MIGNHSIRVTKYFHRTDRICHRGVLEDVNFEILEVEYGNLKGLWGNDAEEVLESTEANALPRFDLSVVYAEVAAFQNFTNEAAKVERCGDYEICTCWPAIDVDMNDPEQFWQSEEDNVDLDYSWCASEEGYEDGACPIQGSVLPDTHDAQERAKQQRDCRWHEPI